MKKIAMLTTFHGYLESYSLCQVARTQLKMMQRAGYECRFIFRGGPEETWKEFTNDIKIIPDYIVDNDGDYSGMEKRAKKMYDEMVMDTLHSLKEHLSDIDVIITHDLFYQPSNSIQDAAAQLYATEHPDKLWLHWIHSATSPKDLNKTIKGKFPNSFICYPNAWDIPRVARNFGFHESEIKVVPHPIDYVTFFDLHPLTQRLIDEKDILSADILCCYPLRLDLGKQPEMAIQILDQAKHHYKQSIRLIIVDFQSSGGDKLQYKQMLKALAAQSGWSDAELTFMSDFEPRVDDQNLGCSIQTPVKVVRDLFMLSNVYIHPSKSETYSLTTQEARACKNMLILNQDFPPMQTIYKEGPMYKKFGSCVDVLNHTDGETKTVYNPDVYSFAKDVAGELIFNLKNQAVLSMSTETRQNKNIDTVFRKHIEPLFYGKASAPSIPTEESKPQLIDPITGDLIVNLDGGLNQQINVPENTPKHESSKNTILKPKTSSEDNIIQFGKENK